MVWCVLWCGWVARAGCPSLSNILFFLYQDPRDPANQQRILDLYAGADDTAKEVAFAATCGRGFCNHYVLGYGIWQGEPAWFFEDGVPIIDAINKIAENEGAWHFTNNYGNLVYLSPRGQPDTRTIFQAPYGLMAGPVVFSEVPDFTLSDTHRGYNELRRNLNVSVPMEQRRNAIYTQGVDFLEYYATFGRAMPRPISRLYKADLNAATFHQIPWYRWVIKADGALVKDAQVKAYHNWLVRMGTRKRMPVSFSGWLHPNLYWLDGIYVEEEFAEVGSVNVGQTPIGAQYYPGLPAHQVPIRIENFHWDVDLVTLAGAMTIEGEVIWPDDEKLFTTFI